SSVGVAVTLTSEVVIVNCRQQDRAMLDAGTIAVKSLADNVFERLLEAIVKGNIKPGDRLSETLIANQLGSSRRPISGAIRRLEGRKLVERTPNVGPRVISLTPS